MYTNLADLCFTADFRLTKFGGDYSVPNSFLLIFSCIDTQLDAMPLGFRN